MTNLGIISGTITDNTAVILDADAIGSEAPYVYGSVYNQNTTTATVQVQVNTVLGLKKAVISLDGSQAVKLKRLQLHSVQSLDTSPSLYYAFSISDEAEDGGVEY